MERCLYPRCVWLEYIIALFASLLTTGLHVQIHIKLVKLYNLILIQIIKTLILKVFSFFPSCVKSSTFI